MSRFLTAFSTQHRREPKEVSRDAMRLLRLYAWPGNIRQLLNLMERLVVTVKEATIQPEHLPDDIQVSTEDARTMVVTLSSSLERIEREVIQRTLAEVTSSVSGRVIVRPLVLPFALPGGMLIRTRAPGRREDQVRNLKAIVTSHHGIKLPASSRRTRLEPSSPVYA